MSAVVDIPDRTRTRKIRVRVTPDELAAIRSTVEACSYPSLSVFLRELAQGEEPKSTLDPQAVLELTKVHADLGRLGGLLKHWLQAKGASPQTAINIRQVLRDIEASRDALRAVILAL